MDVNAEQAKALKALVEENIRVRNKLKEQLDDPCLQIQLPGEELSEQTKQRLLEQCREIHKHFSKISQTTFEGLMAPLEDKIVHNLLQKQKDIKNDKQSGGDYD